MRTPPYRQNGGPQASQSMDEEDPEQVAVPRRAPAGEEMRSPALADLYYDDDEP